MNLPFTPRRSEKAASSLSVTTQTAHRGMVSHIARSALFTALLIASAVVGTIPLPGNPVGITLQTFVLMLIALCLTPSEAAGSVIAYLTIGAVGFPVFSGGMSTLALIGPSAGYLYAFVPAVLLTSLLKQRLHTSREGMALLRDIAVCFLGCVVVPLLSGIPVQALLTGTPISTVATVSLPFIVNDCVKVLVACALVRAGSGIAERLHR